MTELEQKAEEYANNYTDNNADVYALEQSVYDGWKSICFGSYKDGYKDGYKQGQESMMFDFAIKNRQTLLKEIEELKWEQKQILEDNENYQKENEELKAQIEKMKRCSSCKHNYKDSCYIKLMNDIECHNKDKWELAK